MPDFLWGIVYVGAALVVLPAVLVVLVALALSRLRTLANESQAAARQASAVATDVAVVKSLAQDLERDVKVELAGSRRDHAEAAQSLRSEVGERLSQLTGATQQQFRDFDERVARFGQTTQAQLDAVRGTLEQRLDVLREENSAKLEQMRATVDEKLQATLETRLTESFNVVSTRLEQVHQGLGDMQKLAVGVGDLKRVLSNIKSRGNWGEMQLGALLADMLAPHQYGVNIAPVPGENRRVEFAIRVPAPADEPVCWIPVDSKFPVVEWERLQAALDVADPEAAENARRNLERFIRDQARSIKDNYVAPPYTTDFAFLFVPTESLYAELMARPGLAGDLQRDCRVVIAGPTNLFALLSIVQMGFQRAAIEQRSAEAWRLLGAVRTEFGKFGDIIAKAQRKLDEASGVLNDARGKTTTISRRLREVSEVSEADAVRLLAPPASLFDLEPGDEREGDVK
jgi:DNA recombination protein RmuC